MRQCQNSGDRELPLKAEPYINKNGHQGADNCQYAFFSQLGTNSRTNKFGTANIKITSKHISYSFDSCNLRFFITFLTLNTY